MNEESIFAAALEKEPGQVREEFLSHHCGENLALRERICTLLRAHAIDGVLDGASPIQNHSTVSLVETAGSPAAALGIGSIVAGRYQLVRHLGRGGMGDVYLAEQREPIRRKIAIKLIKPELQTVGMLARFERERQALSLMDHPNIAKFYDGGLTETGQPYFVMECIEGLSITEYCDQAQMPVRERLRLFASVCDAVQHAHEKGIIHRDLKPSNILVAVHDGQPIVKVIDFGLAKLVGRSLDELSHSTGFATFLGTPLYMSPEQTFVGNLDVDTRSDIYSLGVVLYELLAGSTPVTARQFRAAAWDEVLGLVRFVDPPKPSQRLVADENVGRIASNRRLEPYRLARLLQTEPDWIVMRCLDKDRGRRYGSASLLASDILQYLQGEAVWASPPSKWYRLRKAAKKNKGLILAISMVLLTLVSGIVGTSYGLMESQRQRRRAEERERLALGAIKRFGEVVVDNLELQNNPDLKSLRNSLLAEPQGFFQSLREMIEKNGNADQSTLQSLADAAFELSVITNDIGDKQAAMDNAVEALAIRKQLIDGPSIQPASKAWLELARSYALVGMMQKEEGQHSEAIQSLREALKIFGSLSSAESEQWRYGGQVVACRSAIAKIQLAQGKLDDALGQFAESIGEQERLLALNSASLDLQQSLATTYIDHGIALSVSGEKVKALDGLEKAKNLLEQMAATSPLDKEVQVRFAESYFSIGSIHLEMGEAREAIAAFEVAKRIQEVLIAERPAFSRYRSDLVKTLIALAQACEQNDDVDKQRSLSLFTEAKSELDRLVSEQPKIIEYQNDLELTCVNLGDKLIAMGRNTEALVELQRANSIAKQLALKYHDITNYQLKLADSHLKLGRLQHILGNTQQAERELLLSADILKQRLEQDPRDAACWSGLGHSLNSLASLYIVASRHAEARDDIRLAIDNFGAAIKLSPFNSRSRQGMRQAIDTMLTLGKLDNDLDYIKDAENKLADWRQADPLISRFDVQIARIEAGEKVEPAALQLLGQRAYELQRYRLTVRLLSEAFRGDSKLVLDRVYQHPYSGACAAIHAAFGRGKDAPPPDDNEERARLRGQARLWLSSELDVWSRRLPTATPAQRDAFPHIMRGWLKDPDLADVRAASIENLPENERAGWREIWRRVEALIKPENE